MKISIAEEIWISLAILHRAHPKRESFTQREMMEQVRVERVHPEIRTGVQWHISLHSVANLPPNPAKIKMLYKLPDGTLRLFRPGDDSHPDRTGRSYPEASRLPERYASLLRWYHSEYCKASALDPARIIERDPVLAMRGVGKEVWAKLDADTFVRDLRADPASTAARQAGVTGRRARG